MSTLALITVNKCDGCDVIAVLQSDEEHGAFEAKWYDGFAKHFCPICKEKATHFEAMRDDRAVLSDMAAGIGDYLEHRCNGNNDAAKSRQGAGVPEGFNGH